MTKLKKFIKNFIPEQYFYKILHLKKNLSINAFKTLTYSGDGEDILILKYFKNKSSGTYVDIGAFHPKYISNTYLLYKKGWSGINVDPNHDAIELFKKHRKNDINLNLGISNKQETLTYYNFTHSGVNTFSKEHADIKKDSNENKLLNTTEIECLPLATILDRHLDGTKIDVLDIDVEGLDLQVLQSNNWDKYLPEMILVEDRGFREEPCSSDTYKYLTERGYKFYAYNNITLVMIKTIAER